MALPFDIYVHILDQLPAFRHVDASVKILVNCSQANSIVRQAAALALIWEPHYRARYIHSNDNERRDANSSDWKLMYAERRRLDNTALRLLDDIVNQRAGRCDVAKTLNQMSFDIWDALEIESQNYLPENFKGGNGGVVASVPRSLTRWFWAQSTLRTISRTYAIQLWGRLLAPDSRDSVSFEESHSSLSCFFGKSPIELASHFDVLTVRCREYLTRECREFNPNASNHDTTNICTHICRFLQSQGFGHAEPDHFHDILNHFPHAYLSTHKRTVPISLVHVFVAIARRLGLAVSPVDFPARVLAHASSPDPEIDDIYVDVFGSASKPILSARDDIPSMLLRAGVSPSSMMQYISPCGGASMLLRAARNIFNSYRNAPSMSQLASQDSMYAAVCIHVLVTGDFRLVSLMMNNLTTDIRAIDCATFLSDTLAPLLQPRARELLEDCCHSILRDEVDAESIVKIRSSLMPAVQIKYFVGMFFEHARHHYIGCIVGWESTCTASEEWINHNGVDALDRGRNQPFYSSLSSAGTETFVAEENITPKNPTQDIVFEFFEKFRTFGMYFEDVDLPGSDVVSGRGRMILSPELRKAYPEDDRAGRLWTTEGM